MRGLFLAAIITLLYSGSTHATVDDIVVNNADLLSSERVGRTLYRYTYTLSITNTAEALTGVVGQVQSTSGATTVDDGTVVFGDVGAGVTVTSADVYVFTHNRRYRFNPANLVWTFTADEPASNTAPVADAGPDQTVAVGTEVTLDGTNSSDADGDALTYAWALITQPAGSTSTLANPDSATPNLNPDVVGEYVAQLIVNDGTEDSLPDTTAINAGVGGNTAPVITSLPVVTGSINTPYAYDVQAFDPDAGDTLSFALQTAPAGMTIDPATGGINWTPGATGVVDVIVQVTDSTGLTAAQAYIIATNLGAGDMAPTIAPIADQTVPVGVTLQVPVIGTDPEGETLRYGLTDGPDGIGINGANGLTQFTPSAAQVGTHPVVVHVADPGGQTATGGFTITVIQEVENTPPDLAPIANVQVNAQVPVQITFSATDPDANEVLVFSLPGLPAGAQFDPVAGTLNWLPTSADAGALALTATVTDSAGGTDSEPFTITVLEPASAPVAVNDTYAVRVGGTLSVPAPGVLDNDFDGNNDVLTASQVDTPVLGTLNDFSADGSFLYTAPPVGPTATGLVTQCTAGGFAVLGEQTVGDLNGDGAVEIVISRTFGAMGALTILRGSDCSTIAELTGVQPFGRIDANSTTLADLDGDGELEILARLLFREDESSTSSWAAFELIEQSPGDFVIAYLWTTEEVRDPVSGDLLVNLNGNNFNAQLSIADLDSDGTPEIIAGFSANNFSNQNLVVVWDHTGAIEWQRFGDYHNAQSPVPLVNTIDLDLDGTLEVQYSSMVLDHEGNVEFFLPIANAGTQSTTTPIQRLWTTIANLDTDPFPEIYARDLSGQTMIFNHDGSLVSTFPAPPGNGGQLVTVAQLDEDPFPELVTVEFIFDTVVGQNNHMHVFEHDGTLKWRHVTADPTLPTDVLDPTPGTAFRGITRPIAFDVDQDGTDELIVFYRHDPTAGIYIIEEDGSLMLETLVPNTFSADFSAPIVADIDADGAAEILHFRTASPQPLTVLEGAPGTPLPPAPAIKSQWNFHPAEIERNGQLVSNEVPHWLIPGFNSVNKIGVVAGLDPNTTDQFSYQANDGAFDSNVATVDITLAASNAPTIISTPLTGTSPGFAYEYAALATDGDFGDLLSWTLADAPDGAVVDTNGIVTWTPEASDVGTSPRVSLVVTDTQGNSDNQVFNITVTPPVAVPDLTGEDETGANDVLTGVGLALGNVRMAYDPTVPVGAVVSQSIAAGATSAAGAMIDIVLSLGPQPIFMPDLTGQALSTAEASLTNLGLALSDATYINNPALRGSVIAQSEVTGELLAPNTTVDLTISGGPAATLELTRNLVGPGEPSTIQSAFFDVDGTPMAAPADAIFDLEVLENPTGSTPVIAGATVTTGTDTRGSYAVRMSSASLGVDLTAELTVSRDAAPDGVQIAYTTLGEQLNGIVQTVDALAEAVLQNDVVAINTLGNQLIAERAALNLTDVQETLPLVLENGFIPLGAIGTVNGIDDVAFPQALGTALAEIESSRSFLAQLVSGAGRNDDVRSIVLNQRLESALDALVAVNAGPRGFAAERTALHQLMSVGLPALLAEDLDRIITELVNAGLVAQTPAAADVMFASQTVADAYLSQPAFFSLGGLMSATRIRSTIIKKFYMPYVRRLVGIAVQTAMFANAEAGEMVQGAEGIITGASLSLHVFNIPNSVLETSWGSEYPGGMDFVIFGPDVVNGYIEYLDAVNSARTANNMREFLQAVNSAFQNLRTAANGEQTLRIDETIRGCILSQDPDCGQLVMYDGYPVVHSIGQLPAPVIFNVRTLGTGVTTTFLANFFPGTP